MAEYTHSDQIDFSVGSENRISINFDGWKEDSKYQLISDIQSINGVTKVNRAGGNTSAYVYFEPREISREKLHDRLFELSKDANYNFRNQPTALGISDAPIEQPNAMPSSNSLGASTAFSEVSSTNEKKLEIHETTLANGGTTARLKLHEISILLPSAIGFVEALIRQAELLGDNGGPEALMPSDLEQLRPLHKALGDLLEMSDSGDFNEARYGGLIADVSQFCTRLKNNLAEDKPYAAGLVMVSAFIGMITLSPTIGASIAGAGALPKGMKKHGKP